MSSYHTTVSGALQSVARLARASPYVVRIDTPLAQAEKVAQKQIGRYPTITASNVTRTHLRKAKLPAVQMVIFPPDSKSITILLMSNIPVDKRENWEHVFDELTPLIWRNYQLTRGKNNSITWKLSEQAKAHYQQRLARLITGRGGQYAQGQKPYQLPDETAYRQVLNLAEHLRHYPGLSGIRADVFDLARYATKMWKSTRPDYPYPEWPTMPYLQFRSPKIAPLSALQEAQNGTQNRQEESPE